MRKFSNKGMETGLRNYLLEDLSDKGVRIFTKKKVVGNKPHIPFTIENVPLYVIGDAEAIGKTVDAIHRGYKTAREIK